MGDGVTNYDPRVTCPAGTKKIYRVRTPWCKNEAARACAKDYGMVDCPIVVLKGCASSADACNDTKFEMFKAVAVSLAKIITMIALPGSNIIINAAELIIATMELAKAAYQFWLKRIKKVMEVESKGLDDLMTKI